MRFVAAVLLLVSALHAGIWGVLRDREPAPDFKGLVPSLSYTPFEPGHVADNNVDPDKIRADLKKLSTLTRAIRSYSATEGNELVPPIAAEFGLKVTVGAWIGKDKDRNEREIRAAIELARKNSNVNGVVVGNEVIYRGEQKVEDLIEMIKKVKGFRARSRHHRRDLEHLARQSRPRLQCRLHRRPRAALLGELPLGPGGRPGR
ncbi:hypothetical protein ACVWXO_008361 [Bradyrhizobium sp. LM2.7]